ncbi:MAG: DNA oxidative demethylase AlkB [Pseudomonadota bacterium]
MDLFANQQAKVQEIIKDAYLLKGFALANQTQLLADLSQVIEAAAFRHMVTPGGFSMSVAMTNCGTYGWVTDRKGYRYTTHDPISHQPWPAMPACFKQLAQLAATEAGFKHFVPDACLINQYKIGARMTLHQDKNEQDFSQPIVSVSLGLPAIFQLGGFERTDKVIKILLQHGDIVVWGGSSRLRFHGILPVKASQNIGLDAEPKIANSDYLQQFRVNLTFRQAAK